MAKYVARRATLLGWFDAPDGKSADQGSPTCVAVKSAETEYFFEPSDLHPALARAVLKVNKYVALTMYSDITSRAIQSLSPQQKDVMVGNMSIRLPIVPCLEDIHPDLTQSTQACIIREENLILVWSDDPAAIMNVGNEVEKELLDKVNLHSHFSPVWAAHMFTLIRSSAQGTFPIRQHLGLGHSGMTVLLRIGVYSLLRPLSHQMFLFVAHWMRRTRLHESSGNGRGGW
jgi:hypothetical protein